MIHWYSEKYSEFLKNNKNPNIKVDKLYLNFRTEFDIYHKCIKLSLYSLQPFQKSKSVILSIYHMCMKLSLCSLQPFQKSKSEILSIYHICIKLSLWSKISFQKSKSVILSIYHMCIKLSLCSLQPFQKSKSGRENYDLTKILKFSVQSLIPLYPEIKR